MHPSYKMTIHFLDNTVEVLDDVRGHRWLPGCLEVTKEGKAYEYPVCRIHVVEVG